MPIIEVNTMASKTPKTPAKAAKKAAAKRGAAKPKLLSGGNPQIAKGDGDAPVQAYIAAMPGWKREVGRRLDALIVRTVPGVRKAVKWNSPFYGVEDEVWFLSFHCFTKYVKVAFFRGASLRPVPPGASKQKDVRYLDIHEDDQLDEAQLAAWVKQASRIARRTHVSGKSLTLRGVAFWRPQKQSSSGGLSDLAVRRDRYRVGDGCHPASDRRIGRETWRAESCGGYCYGDGCAPYPARNRGTSVYALGLLDRTHRRTRAADKGEIATPKSTLGDR